jgi:hypothetical protein
LKLGPGEEEDPNNPGNTRLRTNSPQWIAAGQKHEKDWTQKEFINTKADIAQQKINTILDPKNKVGFERNFGKNYSGYITSQFPDAVVVKKELDDLKDSLKNAGLDMMKTGGSIGAMSVAEWPIVQGVLGSITPGMPEDEAKAKLQEVSDRLEAIRNLGKNSYDTAWSNSQFYNPKTSAEMNKERSGSGGERVGSGELKPIPNTIQTAPDGTKVIYRGQVEGQDHFTPASSAELGGQPAESSPTRSKFKPTQFGVNKKNGRKYFINADGKPEYVP